MSDVEKATSGDNSRNRTATEHTVKQYQQQQQQQLQCPQYSPHHQQHQHHHHHHHQQHSQQNSPHHQQQHQQHHYPEKSSITTSVAEVNTNSAAASITAGSCDALDRRSSNAIISSNANSRLSSSHPCLGRLLKILFSTPGLVLLVVAYSVMGALIFPLLEAPQDITKSIAIAKSREDCLRELWIITEKLNVLYERNWTMLVHEQLRRFEGSIVAATRHGGRLGSSSNTAIAGRFGGNHMDTLFEAHWTFSEALLYSVTVITTIGHGSLTPKTSAGKVATILYALIGVPLMLMCLSSLGALLAEALQCTYARLCCHLAAARARSRRGGDGGGTHQQQQQQQKHRRCFESCESVDAEGGGGITVGEDGIEISGVIKVAPDGHDSECHGSGGHELNCKGCKYDAVIGETNLNNGYDEYSNVKASMGQQRTQDSCQLLHSSPTSVNHGSPCMQLKSATMAANAQCYQRSNSYIQQQQQHADVMLITTTCAEPRASPTMTTTPLSQQKHTQSTLPATSVPTYCSRSATPSPQHQLQHPLQQNYHIITASTNSSPTHGSLQQQQQQQQQMQQRTYQQSQQQQQTHFVAVPSNVVRFQAATATNAATTPHGNIVNCYQPSTVAVTGAATIYFPIAAAAAPTATTIAGGAGSGSAAATAACNTQLLYNQPLVKYHTIQLQHKKPPYVGDTMAMATGHVTFGNVAIATAAGGQQLPPLPPPPAYQTATVHGIRRAKFITKPLPQEINTLLAESDLSCRHDVTQNCNVSSTGATVTSVYSTSSTMTTTAAATSTCTTMLLTTVPATASYALHGSGTRSAAPTAATAVDIMEDEEELEQSRMSNCPHGTPSRVPLISSCSRSGGGDNSATNSSDCGSTKEGSSSKPVISILSNRSGGGASSGGMARGIMHSTAATFHRHTLHTFHRSGTRRKTAAASGRNCTFRSTNFSTNSTSTGCYGDTTETSDDDYDDLCHGSADFVLNAAGRDEDDADDDDTDDELVTKQRDPQVPITIVLLILVCYICLGTVIFALWENWSLIDGAYFCFVTLSTIGYGDFLPERTFHGPEVQLFACCAYLLLGLVLVAMSFSILETQLMWKCKRIAVRLKLAKE